MSYNLEGFRLGRGFHQRQLATLDLVIYLLTHLLMHARYKVPFQALRGFITEVNREGTNFFFRWG